MANRILGECRLLRSLETFTLAARRFFSPQLLSVEDDGTISEVRESSDLMELWGDSLAWALETMTGEVLESGQEGVAARPLANTFNLSLDLKETLSVVNRRKIVFVCQLRKEEEILSTRVLPFVLSKHLSLVELNLKSAVRREGGWLRIEISFVLSQNDINKVLIVKIVRRDQVIGQLLTVQGERFNALANALRILD